MNKKGKSEEYLKEHIALIVSFLIIVSILFFILPNNPNPHLMNYTDCINYRFNEFNFTFQDEIKGMFVYEKGTYNMSIIQTKNVTPIFMYASNSSSRCLYIGRVENMTEFISRYELEYHEIEVKKNKIVGVK